MDTGAAECHLLIVKPIRFNTCMSLPSLLFSFSPLFFSPSLPLFFSPSLPLFFSPSLLLMVLNTFCLHRDAWICDCINITSPAVFDFGYPPIIVVNIKPLSKRGDEGYDPNPVRLRDVKRILQVGPFE